MGSRDLRRKTADVRTGNVDARLLEDGTDGIASGHRHGRARRAEGSVARPCAAGEALDDGTEKHHRRMTK